jgi:hypothetical protein
VITARVSPHLRFTAATAADTELAREMAEYYDDPLGFVRDCFPWGKEPLAGEEGPDENQIEFLESLGEEVRRRNFNGHTPVMPILMTEASGHGTGKSAMGAWIAWWILSTRPGSRGTVTAGTYTQLESRTWAAIQWWGRLCVTEHWFDIQQHGIYSKEDPEQWNLSAQSCKEENYQTFAGQHARTSTSWYLFDEASEVPNKIYETAYGGLTDGEPMMFAWGQCVRNTGEFYEINFGAKAARWNHRRVDSRKSRFTNKELIAQWENDYGIDSDYYRVRVLGMPPSASELQYIDRARVEGARKRDVRAIPGDPLIVGFDVSGGGRAWNVIRFRRGLDMNVRPPIRIPGEQDPDRSQRVAICAELLAETDPAERVAALFIDSAFGAAIFATVRSLGYTNIYEVNFGAASPDPHYLNMRAYMYAKMKDWLLTGSLPDDENLCQQLCLPGYHIRPGGSKLVIESKQDIQKRGEKSPDDADACALTFARPVAPDQAREQSSGWRPPPSRPKAGWLG